MSDTAANPITDDNLDDLTHDLADRIAGMINRQVTCAERYKINDALEGIVATLGLEREKR